MPFPHEEKLAGTVERITYHNEQNGWTVIKVTPFRDPHRLVTVVVHQAKIFAGASMEFLGQWTQHPQHGEQFKATQAIEKKPATTAALEKYLGSGLIKGVGPVTAGRIVKHFKDKTLDVFENNIDALMSVPGIAEKKLADIKFSWKEHKSIRDVMIFLQGYGISTLFAVKIYKNYGDKAIEVVSENPYRLARDIYGIGFFSADKIALAMGFEKNGIPRIEAGIKHVLSNAREEGHCYLTYEQIQNQIIELLNIHESEKVSAALRDLLGVHEIKKRDLFIEENKMMECYYSKSLYYDEAFVASKVSEQSSIVINHDSNRVSSWVYRYCEKEKINLSEEQIESIIGIVGKPFSILTGGPGCGKTTSTKVLVALLRAMKMKIILAAPTGRAAQRMSEVIGLEAKTIHRLLEWAPNENGFKRNEQFPLEADFIIIDECSMLDISLTASLLKAIQITTQILFIGDPDQLPSVGAGNVLYDLICSKTIALYKLTKVFRQAEASSIIRFAHKINKGFLPQIESPIARPQALSEGVDCLFVDSEEATQEQARFIAKIKGTLKQMMNSEQEGILIKGEEIAARIKTLQGEIKIEECYLPTFSKEELQKENVLSIPEKFKHISIEDLLKAEGPVEELKMVLKKIHPWSTLNLGMTALDTIIRLYTKSIPEYLGKNVEIQILSPQVRGSLGTHNLNLQIQKSINPPSDIKKQMTLGERIFRVGDRVIQTRNNYDLGVFNGDIGEIRDMNLEEMNCQIYYHGHQQTFEYSRENLSDIQLAYSITIHKSQGSEFQAVIIPVATQHFKMLFRNLIYTGLTRGKKLVFFVGSRKALAMAIETVDQKIRQTGLQHLLKTRVR